jgi:hypothetical protein
MHLVDRLDAGQESILLMALSLYSLPIGLLQRHKAYVLHIWWYLLLRRS